MSTRAAIGYKRDDESFITIYSHYDGYPEHVGKLLVQHWNSFEKCEELVEGAQIRNFDNDGTVVRFADSVAGAKEEFDSLQDILGDVYDYCYLFDEGEWKCFAKDYSTDEIIMKEIPSENPAPEFKSLNHTISDFVKASDAKYGSYSHAAGFLTGMLLQTESYLPANIKQDLIKYLNQATEECKA